MNILFIHQNFPGQFLHLAPALARRGHRIFALGVTGRPLPGIQYVPYRPKRGTTQNIHPWAIDFETQVIRGQACAAACDTLRQQGLVPDLIVGHGGWGELLFLKDVWPTVPVLGYMEYFYHAHGTDYDFDPEFHQPGWQTDGRLRCKNATPLLTLEAIDGAITPTEWQKSMFPAWWRDRIQVIHEGVDTARVAPNPEISLTLEQAGGLTLRPGDEVVTFVNRNMEPGRGYHRFMRALPEIQRRRPKAVTLIVGADGTSYGAKPEAGTTWKAKFLDEVKDRLDLSRVHFLGRLPYPQFLGVLQVSACHVYLTYPFVLSWSCLEAMSAGCLLVASDTGPVREVIRHGENGLLVDFFDTEALAATVAEGLAEPDRFRPLRLAARQTVVEGYDLASHCLPAQIAAVEGFPGL